MKVILGIVFLAVLLTCSVAFAQTDAMTPADSTAADTLSPPAPPTDVKAVDTPNDHGHSITVTWKLSTDDGGGAKSVSHYEIFRSASPTGPFDSVGTAVAGQTIFVNGGDKEKQSEDYFPDDSNFYYRVDAVTMNDSVRSSSEIAGPAHAYGQWYNTGRTPVLVAVLLFMILTIYFVSRARKGQELYVRPLGGIEAVDDAIGRATEMGRPILYVLGLGTAADVATIAAFTVLGRVAKRVAEYQTDIIVPTYDPIVMTVAQEVVQSAYLDAGRPDTYKEDSVFFVTQSQFAYVAAVNGIMLRELPATNVYMGKFYAESLLLAETGAVAGSIQISGTDEIAQIPFFIVACDYTLIGEELYAASAYLGREPVLLGSLKAQDWGKALVIILAIAGIVAANFGWTWFTHLFKVAN
ncbi:MAG TPA: fibronectin type III domain-containing protein [candidate division Zixibacteria bacterium]|nr:fibronectin type III domain-containing protein [candidate division Zixibacteria bacterium]